MGDSSTNQSAPPRPGSAERPMRVLLIEDDDGDALLVAEELRYSNARVELERAHTLVEAERLRLARFDCALLDLQLPDAAGLDGLRRLREVAPRLAVLVLTGLDDEQRGLEAVAAGAQDYLVKGTTHGVLLARSLRYAIERRRAEEATQQLSTARLEARENARLERGLLPAPLVTDPSLALVTHYRPGRRRALLGGDFFDAVQTADGVVHVVIGDVAGHGPDEAALGVALRIAWRTLVLSDCVTDAVLPMLQQILLAERHGPQVFTTLCAVSLAADRRSANVALAGHPPPLLLADGRPEPVDAGPPGPPLGVLEHPEWPVRRVGLPERWSLLLFTDGATDGRVGQGARRLGEEGLADVVADARRSAGDDPRRLVRRVVERAEELNAGPLADDVALMLIAHRPA